ncbi:MAG: LysR family transcriptional regulator [Gammaproteobacteria bacterium]|jgi:DNA-binding transcriptional LysR family regulator
MERYICKNAQAFEAKTVAESGQNMSTFPSNAAVKAPEKEMEWNDLMVILAVCRAGSLSGAARILGQNHSTIFRKINSIEEKTSVRFFERMPDGYKMTDAGVTAMRYAERIESEVHALGREVLGQDMRLQGKIRVTAPEGMTVQVLPKLFAEFCRQHPEVSIEIAGGSTAVDLTRREADIAIRATAKPPDTSLGRKVCDFRFAIYASPQYLKDHKKVPLQEQNWCFIQGSDGWLVPLIWKKKAHTKQYTVFESGLAMAVLNAAAEGMGVTMMPCYLGDADDRLVRVTNVLESLTLELWILTHPDLRHTARVKALMAILYEALTRDEDLYSGQKVRKKSRVIYELEL